MTDWVRLWHDMPTDPKWRVIARKSGQPLACVIAVFNLMMVSASGNAMKRGTMLAWDDEDAGAALDMDAADVAAIRDAMQGKVLDGDYLTGWERRQPKREDNSVGRVKAYRERKASERNAEERKETPADEVKRNVTQRNAPETDADAETEVPIANAIGADALDPAKVMFDAGVALITQSGKAEPVARSWLGKARKTHGTEAVIAAIGNAKREGAIDPISFMEACLATKARASPVPVVGL